MKSFFKRWWSFSGRVRRARYFLCAILAPLLTLAAGIILLGVAFATFGLFGIQTNTPGAMTAIGVLALLWMLFFCVSVLSFGVRRLHDINLNGFWILLPWVLNMVIGLAFPHFFDSSSRLMQFILAFWPTIFLVLMPGSEGKNSYGIAPEQGFD